VGLRRAAGRARLGRRWTTRIIILPQAPLVRRGPYRFLAHPNYVVVAAEIAVLPMAFGLVGFALLFSALNAVMLLVRIRTEARALDVSQSRPARPDTHSVRGRRLDLRSGPAEEAGPTSDPWAGLLALARRARQLHRPGRGLW